MDDPKIHITLVQYNIGWEEPEQNRCRVENLCAGIVDTDLIVLPEMFSTGFSMNFAEMAEPMDGSTVQWMKTLAAQKQAAVCGSLIIEDSQQYYNRFLFVHPGGEVDFYDKRHLFSMGNEHKAYVSGNERRIIHYHGFRILPLICYDLRFPVWARNHNDYDLMLVVANWPAPRQQVWQTLLQARAIENQAYVAGVNRTGTDANHIYYSGGTCFIDAKGKIIQELSGQSEGVISEQFSLNSLEKFRLKFPVLDDADNFLFV